MWAFASGAVEQGQAALVRRPSPRHRRPHGLPASRQVSEARRPGGVPTQRGPEGPGTRVPAAPHSPAPEQGPPQEAAAAKTRGIGAARRRCWTRLRGAHCGRLHLCGPGERPAPSQQGEACPPACRAPRSVPQRHGQPGTRQPNRISALLYPGWPLENSRAGGRPLAAHLWAWGLAPPSGARKHLRCLLELRLPGGLPGSLQGVQSGTFSHTEEGACLGVLGVMLGSPLGCCCGRAPGGFILTWTLVPEMAPTCQGPPQPGRIDCSWRDLQRSTPALEGPGFRGYHAASLGLR